MDRGQFESIRNRYLAEYPKYKDFAKIIEQRISEFTRTKALKCDVSGRGKEVASLLKKALNPKYTNPYAEINDKAGVRVVAYYPWTVTDICRLVEDSFTVVSSEDKRSGQALQHFDYRGIHYEVKYADAPPEYRDLVCEVQILTRAESLWADTSHLLSYKPAQNPPDHIRRSIYRLAALVELFDSEVERAYIALRSDPGFTEAELLHVLESHYYKFTTSEYNRELSIETLSALHKIMDSDLVDYFDSAMAEFVNNNEDKLREVYEMYKDDSYANPFIWQPEVLLIFLQLQIAPVTLAQVWEDILPIELLLSLANVWGVPMAVAER